MNKKLILLITIVISFTLSINIVHADEKKACIYNKYKEKNETLALVYDGKELRIFYGDGESGYWHSKIGDRMYFFEWSKKPNNLEGLLRGTMKGNDYVDLTDYIKSIEKFDECPQYISLVNTSINNSEKHLNAMVKSGSKDYLSSVIMLTNNDYKIDENKITAKAKESYEVMYNENKYIPIYKLQKADSDPDKIIEKSSDDILVCEFGSLKLSSWTTKKHDLVVIQDYYGHRKAYYDGETNKTFDLEWENHEPNWKHCPTCVKVSDDEDDFSFKNAVWHGNVDDEHLGAYCNGDDWHEEKDANMDDYKKIPDEYKKFYYNHRDDNYKCEYYDTEDPRILCTLNIGFGINGFYCEMPKEDGKYKRVSYGSPFDAYWLWFNYGYKSKCPEKIYVDNDQHLRIKKPESYNKIYGGKDELNDKKDENKKKNEQRKNDIENPEKINSCKELINDDIREIIDNAMKYLRLSVPILLLIFGITDFFKAVFSDDIEAMTASRKRFFKRIIAAIVVFSASIFVSLLLKLANKVWSNISKDTCVKEEYE